MEKDNLLGVEVRIRRGWHGGRTGKVTVFDRHKGQTSSYVEIKVQLDGSRQIINMPGAEEFCRVRSYSSTMKKQGHSVMETIKSEYVGKVLMPALRC